MEQYTQTNAGPPLGLGGGSSAAPGRRPLGCVEESWIYSGQRGSVNTVRMCFFTGPMSEAVVKRAVEILCRRHRVLAARVVREDKQMFLEEQAHLSAPVFYRRGRDPVEDRREVTEELLNDPIDPFEGPLFRVVVLEQKDQSSPHALFLNFHHAINDSTSTSMLLPQFFELCRQQLCGEEIPRLESSPIPQSLDARAPSPKESQTPRRGLFLLKQTRQLILRRPRHLKRKPDQIPRCAVVSRTLARSLSTSLVNACRTKKTTVQGVACAAMLLAIRDELALNRRDWVRCISFVNMRDKVEPRVARDEIGTFISLVSTFHQPASHADMWELAREVKADLSGALLAGEHFGQMYASKATAQICHGLGMRDIGALSVSNIGKIPHDLEFAPLKITEVHACSSTASVGVNLALTLTTLGGEMVWDLLYLTSVFQDQDQVVKILDGAIDLITKAVRDCG